ncbi:MAG: quinone-dependent dihydroorotate dehydrogenase, partial [Leptospiraceae bacterium]|nr:quinone-dependent dihydroorotate dehydrogenase [Leptospiraceae bacterium]
LKTFNKILPISDYGVINISSPNTPGLRGFQEKDSFVELIEGIRNGLGGNFPKPMFVKLAPDLEVSALEELLDLIVHVKLNGIILTNTTINPNALPDHKTLEQGGISGKVLQNKSTEFIKIARKKWQGKLPIIGVGGIMDGESALEKMKAGADLIQIYTGYIYKGPFLPYNILKYLDTYMKKEGINKISEIVGSSV